MNTRYCLVLIISLLFLACACSRSPVMQSLDHAESLMDEHPDSALTMLEAIDGSSLSGESQARYALLLSQAYDKNYIDLTSDSLIGIAAGYYENHSDDRCLMMCNYYKGVVQFNAADYTHCIVSLTKAESLAQKLDDNFYLGRIYTLMGDLYNSTYNSEAQLKCRKLAVAAFSKVKDKDYYLWSMLDLATAYTDDGKAEQCIEMLDSFGRGNDIDVQYGADRMEAAITPLIRLGRYDEARMKLDSLREIASYTLSAGNYANLVKYYLNVGNPDSALSILNNLRKTDIDNNSMAIKLAWIDYYEYTGNFESAFRYLKSADYYQDSIIGDVLKQSVIAAQRDYYICENKIVEDENRHLLLYIFGGCIIALLIVTLIVFFF